MRDARFCIFLTLILAPSRILAQPPPPPPQSGQEYTLPPDKLQKAVEYAHARNWLHFVGEFYEIAALVAILTFGVAARFRDWAEAASRRRIIQAVVFVLLLLLANDLLNLPLGVYSQHLELAFGQSIQSWPSWLLDWTK